MAYEHHESYKHKLAKELLFQWLTEIHYDKSIDYSGDHEFGKTLPFQWRRNYGVFMELPFHETDDSYYFEISKALDCGKTHNSEDGGRWDGCDCERDSLGFVKGIDRGRILFVPDITIFHKGQAKIFIEVVHTSNVSIKKAMQILHFFNDTHIELYEISADSILNCTNKSRSLKFDLIIYDNDCIKY